MTDSYISDLIKRLYLAGRHPENAIAMEAARAIELLSATQPAAVDREASEPAVAMDLSADQRQAILRQCRLYLDDDCGKYNARSVITHIFSIAASPAAPSVEQDERETCVHADWPKACYRVRCQLGNKCVDDDMSFRAASTSANVAQGELLEAAKEIVKHGQHHDVGGGDVFISTCDAAERLEQAVRAMTGFELSQAFVTRASKDTDAPSVMGVGSANVAQGAEAQPEPVYQRRKAGLLAWHDCSYEEYSEVKARIGWNARELYAVPPEKKTLADAVFMFALLERNSRHLMDDDFRLIRVPDGQSLDFDEGRAERRWLWPYLGGEFHLVGFISAQSASGG